MTEATTKSFCFRHIQRPAATPVVIRALSRLSALDVFNMHLRRVEGASTSAKIIDVSLRHPANRELKQWRARDAERGQITVFYFPEDGS